MPLRLTRLPLFLVSLRGFEPTNYQDRIARLGFVPVCRAQFSYFAAKLEYLQQDMSGMILVCLAELGIPSINRRSCLAFHRGATESTSWEMDLFCTYSANFEQCDLFRSNQPHEPNERRWVMVQEPVPID